MKPSDEDVDQVAAMLINGDEGTFVTHKTVAILKASDHAGDCPHAEVKGAFTCGRCLAEDAIKNSLAIFEELKSRGWQKVPEGHVVVTKPETMYALINSSGYRVFVGILEHEAKEAAFGSLPGGHGMNDLSNDELWDMAASFGYSIRPVEVIDRAMIAAKE